MSSIKKYIKMHREECLYLALFFLFPLLLFWRNFDISGTNKVYFSGDFSAYYYPDFAVATTLLSTPKELLWDPYNNLGTPLKGATDRVGLVYPVKAVFYLISALLPPQYRVYLFTYYALFHMSLAACFMYLLTRKAFGLTKFSSFMAGLVFGFSGTLIHFAVTPNHVAGMAYLPLTLFLLISAVRTKDIKYTLLAGISISPTLTNGYTPLFIYSNMFLGLFLVSLFANRKQFAPTIKYFALANIIALLLSALELLPNLRQFQHAGRERFTVINAASYPLTITGILYYVFPYFFNLYYNYVVGYVGILSLILAGLSFNKKHAALFWKLLLIAGFFFVLSLGKITELHSFVYNFVPLYASLHRPATLNYIVGLCIGLLVGFGLNNIQKNEVPIKIKTLYWGTGILGALFLMLNIGKLAFPPAPIDYALESVTTAAVFFVVGLLAIHYFYTNPKSTFIKAVLAVILLIDLSTIVAKSPRFNSTIDPRKYMGENDVIKFLRQNTQTDFARAFLQDTNVRHNSMLVKIFQVNGYYFAIPNRYFSFFKSADKGSPITPESKSLDLAAVKYYVTSKEYDYKNLDKITLAYTYAIKESDTGMFMTDAPLPAGTKMYVYQNLNANPRAYFVRNVLPMVDGKEPANILAKIDARNEAIVSVNKVSDNLILNDGDANARVTIVEYSNVKVQLKVDNPKRGFLVLSDMYFPGWWALVDGKLTTIYKTNLTMRGIFVDKGVHDISFVYIPRLLIVGALISFITYVSVLMYLFRKKRI